MFYILFYSSVIWKICPILNYVTDYLSVLETFNMCSTLESFYCDIKVNA